MTPGRRSNGRFTRITSADNEPRKERRLRPRCLAEGERSHADRVGVSHRTGVDGQTIADRRLPGVARDALLPSESPDAEKPHRTVRPGQQILVLVPAVFAGLSVGDCVSGSLYLRRAAWILLFTIDSGCGRSR